MSGEEKRPKFDVRFQIALNSKFDVNYTKKRAVGEGGMYILNGMPAEGTAFSMPST